MAYSKLDMIPNLPFLNDELAFASGECAGGCGRLATRSIIVDAGGIEVKWPVCDACFEAAVASMEG